MDEFNRKLAEIMEVDEVRCGDQLRDFAEWDSLTVLTVISMIHTDFGVCLSALEMKATGTPESLYHLIGQKRAN